MNYMPNVLEMLGVEVGEKFKVNGLSGSPFKFTDDYCLLDKNGMGYNELLIGLAHGMYEIEKIPWKPKEGEYYYYVDVIGLNAEAEIGRFTWVFDGCDYLYYNSGNCFKTEKEITDEIKQRILQEMKGKYEND